MANVSVVEKNVTLSSTDSIRYQLITHCFLHRITLSEADLTMLVLLAIQGDTELNSFCVTARDVKIFGSAQTVRNALSRAERHKLILKTGRHRKIVRIHPELKLQSRGNILLMYKFLSVEPLQN